MKSLLFISALLLFSTFAHSTDIIKDGQEYPIDKIREQNKKIIKMVVDEISQKLPQKVDNYTTLVKIRDEALTLIYTFEINTGAKSDESVKKEDKARMKRVVSKGICQSSKRFLEAGVTLSYEYISASTQKELFTFTMNQKACEELNL
jgi:glutamine cyclotransferase